MYDWIEQNVKLLRKRGLTIQWKENKLGKESVLVEFVHPDRIANVFYWITGEYEVHLFRSAENTYAVFATRLNDYEELSSQLSNCVSFVLGEEGTLDALQFRKSGPNRPE